MHFTRLRISGFKSFIDPAEFFIDPGLTGIVGPNGCGKSNVVEALGWVMGENSPKRMRGDGMDDVIFSGTTERPPRNLAEVSLKLDNTERGAPAQFNDAEELEVTRRIERGSGSVYRVNGREVRARDVQLLFADAASGAHSSSLVSQGRVDSLINAKPTVRRAILEEAAGITGLHSRRHEAELRLSAADLNLERLDDVMAAHETQLQVLKRQVRQATRYRNISGHIRRAEALVLHLRWSAARAEAEAASGRLERAETEVARYTRDAAKASAGQAKAAERLPALREREAKTAAALHRLAVARDGLEAEEQRLRDEQRALEARLSQIEEDAVREGELKADADEAAHRLETERTDLEASTRNEEAARAQASERLASERAAVAEYEARLQDLTERVAAAAARRNSLIHGIDELSGRVARLGARAKALAAEREVLDAQSGGSGADDLAASEAAGREAARARVAADKAERKRMAARTSEAEARERLGDAEAAASRLRAEADALSALMSVNKDELWPPLIDAVSVESGYEQALGAALGDDLAVPADGAAPVYWKELPPYDEPPALPAKAAPLARFVSAPPVLARRLAQIGVVTDDEGPRLAPDLAQGQRLVSRSGALWRWDGYTVSAGAQTAAATRLSQRNRLKELREELKGADKDAAGARRDFEGARAAAEKATLAEGEAREALKRAETEAQALSEARTEAARQTAAAQSRRAALAEAAERLAADLQEAEREQAQAKAELEALPAEDGARKEVTSERDIVGKRRAALADAQSAHDRLAAEARARASRIEIIDGELASWRRRAQAAEGHLEELSRRQAEASAALTAIKDRPAEIAERRTALFDQIEKAEAGRDGAADALAGAETELAQRDRAAREAQETLTARREDSIRLEATRDSANERVAEVAARIRETIECEAADALAAAEVKDVDELPDLDWVEARLERLKRERDNMGPVNLLAEQEAEELNQQLDTMRTERADLEAAIGRLRQGISSLNREGRERLLAAFGKVDAHFRELFVRLFGGGRAELALTGSDDPLEAGLEIMASPAGKRLQTMSLMSGGEQALTALALLFAEFLTNPAPICVLDEVDAPLDDNNVGRYCDLLDEIMRGTGTRFLIVTHNPITMARMDRLYGVTMGELGVSQLVSVDLARAEGLREVS